MISITLSDGMSWILGHDDQNPDLTCLLDSINNPSKQVVLEPDDEGPEYWLRIAEWSEIDFEGSSVMCSSYGYKVVLSKESKKKISNKLKRVESFVITEDDEVIKQYLIYLTDGSIWVASEKDTSVESWKAGERVLVTNSCFSWDLINIDVKYKATLSQECDDEGDCFIVINDSRFVEDVHPYEDSGI